MTLTQVPLTGTFRTITSNVVTGSVVIEYPINAANTGNSVSLPPIPVEITLTTNGQIPAGTTIYATDDDDTDPANLYVEITEKFSGAPARKRKAPIPNTATNGLDYSQIVWSTSARLPTDQEYATASLVAGLGSQVSGFDEGKVDTTNGSASALVLTSVATNAAAVVRKLDADDRVHARQHTSATRGLTAGLLASKAGTRPLGVLLVGDSYANQGQAWADVSEEIVRRMGGTDGLFLAPQSQLAGDIDALTSGANVAVGLDRLGKTISATGHKIGLDATSTLTEGPYASTIQVTYKRRSGAGTFRVMCDTGSGASSLGTIDANGSTATIIWESAAINDTCWAWVEWLSGSTDIASIEWVGNKVRWIGNGLDGQGADEFVSAGEGEAYVEALAGLGDTVDVILVATNNGLDEAEVADMVTDTIALVDSLTDHYPDVTVLYMVPPDLGAAWQALTGDVWATVWYPELREMVVNQGWASVDLTALFPESGVSTDWIDVTGHPTTLGQTAIVAGLLDVLASRTVSRDQGNVAKTGDTLTGELNVRTSEFETKLLGGGWVVRNDKDDTFGIASVLNILGTPYLLLGAGGASALDWQLSRSEANVATLGSGDYLRAQADPAHNNDLTRKSWVDTSISAVATTKVSNSTLTTNTILYATNGGNPQPLALAASTFPARLASGNIVAATPAEVRSELGTPRSSLVHRGITLANSTNKTAILSVPAQYTAATDDYYEILLSASAVNLTATPRTIELWVTVAGNSSNEAVISRQITVGAIASKILRVTSAVAVRSATSARLMSTYIDGGATGAAVATNQYIADLPVVMVGGALAIQCYAQWSAADANLGAELTAVVKRSQTS